MALSVSLQIRDGQWIELGTQTFAGIDPATGLRKFEGYGVVPGSVDIDGDTSEYGCLSASFRLKLDPRWIETYGELEQFTPAVIEQGTDPRWSGRIISVATNYGEDAELVVSLQGWGQHLKDDVTAREWVVADVSRFVDQRTIATTALTNNTSQFGVSVGDGVIVLSYPKGSPVTTNEMGGVVLDLGPNNVAATIVAEFEHSSTGANFMCYVSAGPNPWWISGRSDAMTFSLATATPATYAAAVPVPGRYVSISLYCGSGYTPGTDVFLRIKNVKIFTDGADQSGNASILKASTVISEVLDECAPLISRDRSRIAATSFSIPAFPGGPGRLYANEVIDKANTFHGFAPRLSPDPVPIFEYQPLPSTPSFLVALGVDPGVTFQEPAALDGRGIYSRVITEFEDAAGAREEAISGSVGGNGRVWALDPYVVVAGGNTRFDTNTAGWTLGGSAARSTGVFASAPASLLLGSTGTATALITNLQVGTRYRIRFAVRDTIQARVLSQFGTQGLGVSGATFVDTEMWFEATATTETLYVGGMTANSAVDDFIAVDRFSATVVDRRSFRRTALRPMSSRSTAAAAAQIARIEANAARYPSIRGTLAIPGSIRTPGGGSVDASILPSSVGEMLLIENLTDENTLALGRGGIIRSAKYSEETDIATVTIDDPKSFIDVLRTRIQTATA